MGKHAKEGDHGAVQRQLASEGRSLWARLTAPPEASKSSQSGGGARRDSRVQRHNGRGGRHKR